MSPVHEVGLAVTAVGVAAEVKSSHIQHNLPCGGSVVRPGKIYCSLGNVGLCQIRRCDTGGSECIWSYPFRGIAGSTRGSDIPVVSCIFR